MQLQGKRLLLVGFTLFSMFFGAGNLIFPPFLGAQAGTSTWPGHGRVRAQRHRLPHPRGGRRGAVGGLSRLAGRVHPRFAAVYTMLIYLSIGPCLAIPRTASTSFEMAVSPFLPPDAPFGLLQLGYSALFFGVALLLALKPEKLTDRLGKVLCPTLLLLILVIFLGCALRPPGGYGAVTDAYASNPAVQGFLVGYQTMDTIAALNFGIVIALNIRAGGVKDDGAVVRGTVRARLARRRCPAGRLRHARPYRRPFGERVPRQPKRRGGPHPARLRPLRTLWERVARRRLRHRLPQHLHRPHQLLQRVLPRVVPARLLSLVGTLLCAHEHGDRQPRPQPDPRRLGFPCSARSIRWRSCSSCSPFSTAGRSAREDLSRLHPLHRDRPACSTRSRTPISPSPSSPPR